MAEWATGTGKSGIAIRWVEAHPGHGRCLVVVPERDNVQNWRDEFAKAGVSDFGVDVICYASLKNYADTSWDLLVLDEAPHCDTEKREEVLSTVEAGRVLALGAVIDPDERASLERCFGKFERSVVDVAYAVELGILPTPEVRVLHMSMPEGFRAKYNSADAAVRSAANRYNAVHTKWAKDAMLHAGVTRKRLLGILKSEAMRKVCSELSSRGLRFICFCASVDQAERLGGDLAYTSRTKASARTLERFNDGETDAIYVVGKLIEGQNLRNIQCGVIGQLGGTERITVQSVGRVMRSDRPVIYAPVFDGTKDDAFLRTLVASVPSGCIKHYSL